jgi:hypothetical protein
MRGIAPSRPMDSSATILLLLLLVGARGMDDGVAATARTVVADAAGRSQFLQDVAVLRATAGRYGCRHHHDCAPEEFCAAEFCAAAEVKFPCGKCRSCNACLCDSSAIDHYCPASCGMRRCLPIESYFVPLCTCLTALSLFAVDGCSRWLESSTG